MIGAWHVRCLKEPAMSEIMNGINALIEEYVSVIRSRPDIWKPGDAYLGEVNWYEIAEYILSGVEEEVAR
jgi:hypothetical protein